MVVIRKQAAADFRPQVHRTKRMPRTRLTTEADETADGVTDLKRGLPPIVRADAKLLILGSLPSDASLAAAQYYAHPHNQFWRLLGGVIGQNLKSMDYSERVAVAVASGVALWDVIGSAQRAGSLDHRIRNEQPNDLCQFAQRLLELRAVAFNGKKAGALAGAAFDGLPIAILHLPSSSPAYTMHPDAKAVLWARLAQYLNP